MRLSGLVSVALWVVLGGCSAAPARVSTASRAVTDDGLCSSSQGKGCVESDSGPESDETEAAQARGMGAEATSDDERAEDDGVDDEAEDADIAEPGQVRAHPLDVWSRSQIEQAVANDPRALGSMSIGAPNGGSLLNAVSMPEGDGWTIVDPAHAFATQETTAALAHCIERVRAGFPNTAPLHIGHLSAPKGGHLSPHRSHQSGRDVDVGYYYTGDVPWYTRATATNLDRARTWAFVRAVITDTDVEYIFIDKSIQTLLRQYATTIGEPKAWIDSIFDGARSMRPIIRHAKGHSTHIHVRFYNPVAQETARRVYALLVEHKRIIPTPAYVRYVAKKGDSLGKIAKQFGTTTKAIQEINRLKSTRIRAGTEYRIARRGHVAPPTTPTLIPARRLPPDGAILPVASGGGASGVAASSALARPVATFSGPTTDTSTPHSTGSGTGVRVTRGSTTTVPGAGAVRAGGQLPPRPQPVP